MKIKEESGFDSSFFSKFWMNMRKMLKILIVNNAEPGITEFTKPVEKIIADADADSFCIEYKQCIALMV